MEKTYIVEIRDLTFEAKELNAQSMRLKKFEEETRKEIKVLAETHVSAIVSYLNHQLNEITKFTSYFHAEYYVNNTEFSGGDERITVKIEKSQEGLVYILSIKPQCYFESTNFILNSKDYHYCHSWTGLAETFPSHAEALIKNWKKLKHEIQERIKITIKDLQEENQKAQINLNNKLALYENFEL